MKTIPSRDARRGAFTLVELLVVIAIISILAAMLLPVLQSALEQARAVGCMANLKQITLGMSMYSSDYTGYYPPGSHLGGATPPGPNLTWHGFLYPYLDVDRPDDPNKFWWFAHERIYLCPSKPPPLLEWGTSSYGSQWFNRCVGSVHPCANAYNCERKHYFKADEHGGKTIYAADSPGDKTYIYRGANPSLRHPGGANLLYWDLHVNCSAAPERGRFAPGGDKISD